MNLVHWDPLRELDEFGERLNQLFRKGSTARTEGREGRESLAIPDFVPPVDITETTSEYQIKVELPEIARENVHIHVQNNLLRIEGERTAEKEEKGKKVHRVERMYGSFLRTFTIPEDVDDAAIKAEFKDGVLVLRLPKSEKAQAKSREIKVS